MSNSYLDQLALMKNDAECQFNCVSLSSGCGSLALSAYLAGFRPIFVNDTVSLETVKRNFPDVTTNISDIYHLTSKSIIEQINEKKIDLLVISLSLQTIYSSQKTVNSNDGIVAVLTKISEYLIELRPLVFVIETMPALIMNSSEEDYTQFCSKITEKTDYRIYSKILNSVDYGIPQKKERLFIVGFRNDVNSAGFHFPRYKQTKEQAYTPCKYALEEVDDLPNQIVRYQSATTQDRLKKVAMGEKDPKTQCERLDPEQPTSTVLVSSTYGVRKQFIHPYENRFLTVREAARLQSIPDWYEICGSIPEQYDQIGNASSPLMIIPFMQGIRKVLNKYR